VSAVALCEGWGQAKYLAVPAIALAKAGAARIGLNKIWKNDF